MSKKYVVNILDDETEYFPSLDIYKFGGVGSDFLLRTMQNLPKKPDSLKLRMRLCNKLGEYSHSDEKYVFRCLEKEIDSYTGVVYNPMEVQRMGFSYSLSLNCVGNLEQDIYNGRSDELTLFSLKENFNPLIEQFLPSVLNLGYCITYGNLWFVSKNRHKIELTYDSSRNDLRLVFEQGCDKGLFAGWFDHLGKCINQLEFKFG